MSVFFAKFKELKYGSGKMKRCFHGLKDAGENLDSLVGILE